MVDRTFQHERVAEQIGTVLAELIRLSGLDLKFQTQNTAGVYQREFESPDLLVTFEGRDAEYLLANKAEMLKAIEQFTLEAIRLPQDDHEKVFFDCQEYRMMRIDELQMAAQAAAERVRRTGAAYEFSPMNSRERRVIHMSLRNVPGVKSESTGEGQFRRVVIQATDAQPKSKPFGRRH